MVNKNNSLGPSQNADKYKIISINPICTVGGQICPPLCYFNIVPKLRKIFALMHPDFESNLITNIFRNFGVSWTTGSDVIFAFVRGTQQVLYNYFRHNACLSDLVFYSLYCVFIINVYL